MDTVEQRNQAATEFHAKLQVEAATLTELISQDNGD